MKAQGKVLRGLGAFGLSVLLAACAPAGTGGTGSGGAPGGTGSGGAPSGTGSGGAPGGTGSGGETGSGSGGMPGGTGSGGETGSGSGGMPGGTGSGGATPGSGGRTGTATGGSGTATGGSGTGTSTGGSTPGTGGAPGTGGGAPGTGGRTTTALPRLVTSGPSGYWTTTGTVMEVTTGTVEVTVNDASPAQNWEGFGGAFNEMGWNYLSMLSAADRDRALKLLFDAADGAHFVLGRIPMGASDYAMDRYTLDETANDTALGSFSISRDMMKLIPFIKAAQGINANIRFWASPWTPPTWMKSSPYQTGNVVSPFDGGTMKSDDATLKALAQYFVKFVQEYGKQNITVETVAPQNEPNYGQNYPSCIWASATYTKFVGSYLGPAFTAASLPTKIMLGTMSNPDSGKDPAIVSAMMGDATAKGYVKSVGMQWGMLPSVAAAKSFNVPIWQTEHKCGNYPWESATYKATAPNDQAYAVESWGLIRDWIKAGVSAYSSWNMVLDSVGKGIDTTRQWAQNALLTVDTGAKTLKITPTYYVFRHLSQYVDVGAKVVPTTGGDALAFKNPNGTVVTVMYNSGAAKTTIVSAGGKRMQFMIPATGWATVTSQ